MKDPILFDVDGVANEFTQALLDATRARLNEEGHATAADEVPDAEAITSYTISDHLSELAWSTAAHLLSTSSEFWGSLRPDEGALKAVDLIRQRGEEVVFVTSPWDSNPTWGSVRYQWLRRHYGIKRDQLVITPRKELVRGVRLYEDRAETLFAWINRNVHLKDTKGILIARPWNSREKCSTRFTWEEALEELGSWLTWG